MTAPSGPVTRQAAYRFLDQATFGPTQADIDRVIALGFDGWIAEQSALAATLLPTPKTDAREEIQAAFFKAAIESRDQLRQRVAFALSEILVVSGRKVTDSRALVSYHQMLVRDALGLHATLLKDVTLAPAMGWYLDLADNSKADAAAGTSPNENYARELLQLFSVGPSVLNQDGSLALNGGRPAETYNQDVVEGFARALTGWTYQTTPDPKNPGNNLPRWDVPLVPVEDRHEPGSKLLLSGVVVPAGGSTRIDLDTALANVLAHPNAGPFLARRLIQSLVTSNPSPQYIERVSRVYTNDGVGRRGNLQAVVRAILLDPEARAADNGPPRRADGKLREPVLYVTRLMRALGAKTDGVAAAKASGEMRQEVFNAPSVFNFFPVYYRVNGGALNSPESRILDGVSTAGRLNFASDLAIGALGPGTVVDYSEMTKRAGDVLGLVAYLNDRLLAGNASAALVRIAGDAAQAASEDPQDRVGAALYLFAVSPDLYVQR